MLQSPFTVRSTAGGSDHHVDVADLELTDTARGGYESATFTLPEWVTAADPALGPLAKVRVYDTRNANTLFEGSLDIAGKTVDTSGHTWRVGAVGASSVLGDRDKPWIGIDSDPGGWFRKYTGAPGSTASIASLPADEDTPALLEQFPSGQPIANGSTAAMQYDRLVTSGQRLGGFQAVRVSGLVSTDYRMQYSTRPTHVDVLDQPFDTVSAGGSAATRYTPAHFGASEVSPILKIQRATGGATNVTSDDVWGAWSEIVVRPILLDQSGADITGVTYADGWVYAHQAVVDMLWWFTNQIDIPGAFIDDTFTHQIDQLAYPDGVRLPDVLADIALLEPDAVWGVFESNAAGLHRFEYRKWPTVVRYEVDTRDGWSSPGGEALLANSLTVYWTDARGHQRSSVYEPSDFGLTGVAALDQWGRRRDAEAVTLSSEVGSQAAADRVAEMLLTQIATVPYSGTLTVARPVLDRLTGRTVMPWEIQAGYLVNVRDIDAPPMRLTERSYRDSEQAASLTLGTPTYSSDELVAKLTRQRNRGNGAKVPLVYA